MELYCAETEEEAVKDGRWLLSKVEALLIPLHEMIAGNDLTVLEMKRWIIAQHFSISVAWYQCNRKMMLKHAAFWQGGEGRSMRTFMNDRMSVWMHEYFQFFFGLK